MSRFFRDRTGRTETDRDNNGHGDFFGGPPAARAAVSLTFYLLHFFIILKFCSNY